MSSAISQVTTPYSSASAALTNKKTPNGSQTTDAQSTSEDSFGVTASAEPTTQRQVLQRPASKSLQWNSKKSLLGAALAALRISGVLGGEYACDEGNQMTQYFSSSTGLFGRIDARTSQCHDEEYICGESCSTSCSGSGTSQSCYQSCTPIWCTETIVDAYPPQLAGIYSSQIATNCGVQLVRTGQGNETVYLPGWAFTDFYVSAWIDAFNVTAGKLDPTTACLFKQRSNGRTPQAHKDRVSLMSVESQNVNVDAPTGYRLAIHIDGLDAVTGSLPANATSVDVDVRASLERALNVLLAPHNITANLDRLQTSRAGAPHVPKSVVVKARNAQAQAADQRAPVSSFQWLAGKTNAALSSAKDAAIDYLFS